MTKKVKESRERKIDLLIEEATILELNNIIKKCQQSISRKKINMKKDLPSDIVDQLEELQRLKEKQLTTPKEVAKIIGVSRVSIYRWIKSGILEGHKFGGVVRIKKEDLEKFVKNRGE